MVLTVENSALTPLLDSVDLGFVHSPATCLELV